MVVPGLAAVGDDASRNQHHLVKHLAGGQHPAAELDAVCSSYPPGLAVLVREAVQLHTAVQLLVVQGDSNPARQ